MKFCPLSALHIAEHIQVISPSIGSWGSNCCSDRQLGTSYALNNIIDMLREVSQLSLTFWFSDTGISCGRVIALNVERSPSRAEADLAQLTPEAWSLFILLSDRTFSHVAASSPVKLHPSCL
jgi:hypothetical protein